MGDMFKYDWQTDLKDFANRHDLGINIDESSVLKGKFYIHFYTFYDIRSYPLNEVELGNSIKFYVDVIKRELVSIWGLESEPVKPDLGIRISIDDIAESSSDDSMTVEEIDQCLRKFATEGWLKVNFDSLEYDRTLEELARIGVVSSKHLRRACKDLL